MRFLPLTLVLACSLLALNAPAPALGHNILGVFAGISQPHNEIGLELFKQLAEQGHNVTFMSTLAVTEKLANFEHVHLAEQKYVYYYGHEETSLMSFVASCMAIFFTSCYGQPLDEPAIKRFLDSDRHYDAVVVQVAKGDGLLALGRHFGAPVVAFSTLPPTTNTLALVGSPIFSSHMPSLYTVMSDDMWLAERLYNSLLQWMESRVWRMYDTQYGSDMMRRLIGGAKDWPQFADIATADTVLLFTYAHPMLALPQPLLPNVIDVTGIQIAAKRLQPDVQQFLDGATHGVVYISLGHDRPLNELDEVFRRTLCISFSRHSQMRMMVRTRGAHVFMSHQPEDLFFAEHFNQSSVLAHKNVRLFVTQGGVLSLSEALHFGKPVLGLPVRGDQFHNMAIAVQKGYAISVPHDSVTEQRLQTAIQSLLTDDSYMEAANRLSAQYRNRLRSPMAAAVYWVGYVAKHKTVPQLHSITTQLLYMEMFNADLVTVAVLIFVFAGIFGVCSTPMLCRRYAPSIIDMMAGQPNGPAPRRRGAQQQQQQQEEQQEQQQQEQQEQQQQQQQQRQHQPR